MNGEKGAFADGWLSYRTKLRFKLKMNRYDLTDFESRVAKPLLPNKPRGCPVLSWSARAKRHIMGALIGSTMARPARTYGPRTTCYNRFVRWRRAGVWDRLMDAISATHDGNIEMIDSTSVRAHQQAATAKRGVQIIVSVDHAAGSPPRSMSLLTPAPR